MLKKGEGDSLPGREKQCGAIQDSFRKRGGKKGL